LLIRLIDPHSGNHFDSYVDALDKFASMNNVSDPRDRIYAALTFHVDYTIFTSQAYRRFVVELVQETGSLAVLRLVRGSDDPILPSWVMDWNIFTTSPNWMWQGARVDVSDYDPYAAAKGRFYRPATSQHADDMRLVSRSRIIDKVERISSVLFFLTIYNVLPIASINTMMLMQPLELWSAAHALHDLSFLGFTSWCYQVQSFICVVH
jgi:hypothetical protein